LFNLTRALASGLLSRFIFGNFDTYRFIIEAENAQNPANGVMRAASESSSSFRIFVIHSAASNSSCDPFCHQPGGATASSNGGSMGPPGSDSAAGRNGMYSRWRKK